MKQDGTLLFISDENPAGEENKDDVGVPENWPLNVIYLSNHSISSDTLSPHLALHLCVAPKSTHELHPAQVRRHGWTCIKQITKETPFQPAFGSRLTTHPTLGQNGLFARKDIPPNTLVVPYLGTVHHANDEDLNSRYDAAVEAEDGTRCGIDATSAGNEARFVNDYRGILQRPNLFFQDWTARFSMPLGSTTSHLEFDTPAKYPKKVKGLALYSGAHTIRAGTELCASYGKGWWASRAGQ